MTYSSNFLHYSHQCSACLPGVRKESSHVSDPVPATYAFRHTSQVVFLFPWSQIPPLLHVMMSRLPGELELLPLQCPARGDPLLISGYSRYPILLCVLPLLEESMIAALCSEPCLLCSSDPGSYLRDLCSEDILSKETMRDLKLTHSSDFLHSKHRCSTYLPHALTFSENHTQ